MRSAYSFSKTAELGNGLSADSDPPSTGPSTGTADQIARSFNFPAVDEAGNLIAVAGHRLALSYQGPGSAEVTVEVYQWFTDSAGENGQWVLVSDPVFTPGQLEFVNLVPPWRHGDKQSIYLKVLAQASASDGTHRWLVNTSR